MIVIACDVCKNNTNQTHDIVSMISKYTLNKNKEREKLISVTMSSEMLPAFNPNTDDTVSIHVCSQCRTKEQNKLLKDKN